MRKLASLSCIVLLLSCSKVIAQVDSTHNRRSVGINISAWSEPDVDVGDFDLFPHVTFSCGRHRAFLGPTISSGWYPDVKSVVGVMGGYQIFPNPKQRRFNYFFELNIAYYELNREVKEFVGTGIDEYTTQDIVYQNHLGFGFKLNMTERVYLNSSFGVGLYWTKLEWDYANEDYENYIIKGWWFGGSMLKVGAGLDLLTSRK